MRKLATSTKQINVVTTSIGVAIAIAVLSVFLVYSFVKALHGHDFFLPMLAGLIGPILGVIGAYSIAYWRFRREQEQIIIENVRIYFRELEFDFSAVKILLAKIKINSVEAKDVGDFRRRSRTPTAYLDKSFMRGFPHEIQTYIFIIEEARAEIENDLSIYDETVEKIPIDLRAGFDPVNPIDTILEMKPHLKKILKYMKLQRAHVRKMAK